MTSAQWFRQHGYLMDGQYSSLEDFLRADWEGGFLGTWDANDMITLINTWQDGDVTLVGKSQFRAAHDDDGFVSVLRSIKAKGLIMPCKTDLYFCVRDSFVPSALSLSLATNAEVCLVLSRGACRNRRRHIAVGGHLASRHDRIEFAMFSHVTFFSDVALWSLLPGVAAPA